MKARERQQGLNAGRKLPPAVGQDIETEMEPERSENQWSVAANKLYRDAGGSGYVDIDPFDAEAALRGVTRPEAMDALRRVVDRRLDYVVLDDGQTRDDVLRDAKFDQLGLLNIPMPDFDDEGRPVPVKYGDWKDALHELRAAKKRYDGIRSARRGGASESSYAGKPGSKDLLTNMALVNDPTAAVEEIFGHLPSGGTSIGQLRKLTDAINAAVDIGGDVTSGALDEGDGPFRHYRSLLEMQGAAHIVKGLAKRLGLPAPVDRKSATAVMDEFRRHVEETHVKDDEYVLLAIDRLLRNESEDRKLINRMDSKDFWDVAYLQVDDPKRVHAAEAGGDAGNGETVETAVSETPVSEPAAPQGGPRIVLNPKVLTKEDPRDGLCTAFNEAIRVVCEMNGFEPVSEPTEAQRKFFAETAYADDELQLRRTILARIATLDTSVKDPTDEQLEETAEMLEMVMEVGAPQNEWEQQAVQRLHDVVVKAREASAANGSGKAPEPPKEEGSAQAAMGGGVTDDDELKYRADPDVPGVYVFANEDDYSNWSKRDTAGEVGDVRWVNIRGKDDSPGVMYKQTYGERGWSGEVASNMDAATKEALDILDGRKPDYNVWNGGKPAPAAVDPMTSATNSALAGLANMEPDKAEPQAAGLAGTEPERAPEKAPEAAPVPSGTGMAGIPSGTGGEPPETAVAGAPGTSSPNWANGAVVGKDDPGAFGRVEHSWANGQDVAGFKDDVDAFGTETPGIRGVAMPKPVEAPKLNWRGLASRTDARGRYFDNDGRVITKRQAERMERKRREELGFA